MNAVKYRIGTFRLHVKLARKLSSIGFTVMTFDPEGIGDSEGPFEHKLLSEHYFDIQTGKFDGDLSDAIGKLHGLGLVDTIFLLGLCGGAVSVMTAGATDPRVAGMILLNIPVLTEDLSRRGEADAAAKITSKQAAFNLLKSKMHRLLEGSFWLKLIRFRIDWREEWMLVLRSLLIACRAVVDRLRPASGSRQQAPNPSMPVSSHPLFNFRIQESFLQAAALRKQLLFIFAELDPWTWIFQSEFRDILLREGNPHEDRYSIHTIHAANHIFSSRESQEELDELISKWLASRAVSA